MPKLQLVQTYVSSSRATYVPQPTLMFDQISNTRKIKGRGLYYYPKADAESEDGWIGWHNDSGFLTALTRCVRSCLRVVV